jgi:hypothetical protein
MDEYTELFRRAIEENPLAQERLDEALALVRPNSQGLYVIGGFVYRNILSTMGRKELPEKVDIDFCARSHSPFSNLGRWVMNPGRYGGFKFVNRVNKHVVDFTECSDFFRFIGKSSEDIGIYDVLETTPLNIQSIAYDVERGIVIGEKGKKALVDRVVRVNDQEEFEFECQMAGADAEAYLILKAESLGFDYEFEGRFVMCG